jgi:hypothetical protein
MILLLSRLVQLSGNEMKRKKYIIFLVIGAVGYFFILFVANNQGLLNP